MIAYIVDGAPPGQDGFARIIAPGDISGGRYVSNLVSLQVIDAVVGEPGSLLLVASGLIGMVLSPIATDAIRGRCTAGQSSNIGPAWLFLHIVSARFAGWQG